MAIDLIVAFRKNKHPPTQLCAIDAISTLILEYPALSAAFRAADAGKYLAKVLPNVLRCRNAKREALYTAARRSLVCVEEVEVLKIGCRLELCEYEERDER